MRAVAMAVTARPDHQSFSIIVGKPAKNTALMAVRNISLRTRPVVNEKRRGGPAPRRFSSLEPRDSGSSRSEPLVGPLSGTCWSASGDQRADLLGGGSDEEPDVDADVTVSVADTEVASVDADIPLDPVEAVVGDVDIVAEDASVNLASSAITECQLFRHGSNVYGFQYHAEIDRPLVEVMCRNNADYMAANGFDAGAIIADSANNLPAFAGACEEMLQRWLDLIAPRQVA